MNTFIEHLDTLAKLSEKEKRAINSITVNRNLPKGTTLLLSGNVCKEFHFLASGLARVYYLKDGRDVTAWFSDEYHIASAIDSLFSGKPSMYNIELLEDSKIYSVKYSNIEVIFEKYPSVERIGRILVTENYLLLDERVKLFVFCTAEERYEKLLEQLPNIFNRVKLGHIASYLGMTQEHLSRIRGLYKSKDSPS